MSISYRDFEIASSNLILLNLLILAGLERDGQRKTGVLRRIRNAGFAKLKETGEGKTLTQHFSRRPQSRRRQALFSPLHTADRTRRRRRRSAARRVRSGPGFFFRSGCTLLINRNKGRNARFPTTGTIVLFPILTGPMRNLRKIHPKLATCR